jgi:hypothetical protein
MKNSKALLLFMCLSGFLNTYSQDDQAYFVLDEGIEEIAPFNMLIPQLDHSYVFTIDGFSPNAVVQIAERSKGLEIEELHLFVLTKPGAIVFNSVSVATDNEDEWSSDIKQWGEQIRSSVVVHSSNVFSGAEGALLKQRLESVSGLEFISQDVHQ